MEKQIKTEKQVKTEKQIFDKIQVYIEKQKLISYGDTVLVGFSGGADSVCLMDFLGKIREKYELKLVAAHLNHGIRGKAAEEDAVFVTEFCRARDIPVEVWKRPVAELAEKRGISLEEAGREERYHMFSELAEKYQAGKTAVAHHMDDQAETVLFRMARGTGLPGLRGMAPLSRRKHENRLIIRPLLCINKKEIESYIQQNKLSYRTDQSNFEMEYTRNRIRLEILPRLEQMVNAQAAAHIAGLAERLSESFDFIQKSMEPVFAETVSWQINGIRKRAVLGELDDETEKSGAYLKLEVFLKVHRVLQKEVMRNLLKELAGSLKDITEEHIESLLDLAEGGNGRRLALPYGLCAVKEYQELHIYLTAAADGLEGRKKPGKSPDNTHGEVFRNGMELLLEPIPTEDIYLEEMKKYLHFEIIRGQEGVIAGEKTGQIYKFDELIQKNDYTKCFDYDKIKNAVLLRNRRSKDVIVTDKEGHHKKVKQYFIEEKIPREQRSSRVLLADGEEVIWIIGKRISEAYKVGNNTKKILLVSLYDPEDTAPTS